MGDNGEKGITATCPKHMEAISGGYSVRPRYKALPKGGPGNQGEVSIDTDKRSGSNKWYVHAGNDGDANGLAAFVLCQPNGTSTITQVSHSEISAGGPIEADAECPTGHLVGGGFRIQPSERQGGIPFVNASFPGDPGTWVALWAGPSFKDKRGFSTPTLTSFAECES